MYLHIYVSRLAWAVLGVLGPGPGELNTVGPVLRRLKTGNIQ